ncbi:MAG: hypothetical protein EKK36_08190 [Bradyrhizobiaceae bacterium]|nr:MAG: hypothetical protein EKK36_08190 [Bradyrhizobiaceae bacterium]
MATETPDEASNEVVRAPKRDRRTERTVDLNEPEIAAIEAAGMTPEEEPSHVPGSSNEHLRNATR